MGTRTWPCPTAGRVAPLGAAAIAPSVLRHPELRQRGSVFLQTLLAGPGSISAPFGGALNRVQRHRRLRQTSARLQLCAGVHPASAPSTLPRARGLPGRTNHGSCTVTERQQRFS